MTDVPLHDGDLAYVRPLDRSLDQTPTLARYRVLWEAEKDEPEVGVWQFFGTEWTYYRSEIEIITRATIVGPGAVDEAPALHHRARSEADACGCTGEPHHLGDPGCGGRRT